MYVLCRFVQLIRNWIVLDVQCSVLWRSISLPSYPLPESLGFFQSLRFRQKRRSGSAYERRWQQAAVEEAKTKSSKLNTSLSKMFWSEGGCVKALLRSLDPYSKGYETLVRPFLGQNHKKTVMHCQTLKNPLQNQQKNKQKHKTKNNVVNQLFPSEVSQLEPSRVFKVTQRRDFQTRVKLRGALRGAQQDSAAEGWGGSGLGGGLASAE